MAELLPEGHVVAIDPGALKIEMKSNITHLKQKGEQALQYLKENGPYHILVRDSINNLLLPHDTF